ncbi:MAG: hypothetical protein QOE71_4233 [Pseudonocardiales bacterium]|jgi:Mce-associated membrane protein|nr:hypothetical protein [Pseudonocardiales bacterium]MDT4914770.1 hypothetical protein [Pseudonocardiales bacterium]
MPESRRAPAAPWIAAAVAGAILVALLVTYFVALRPAQDKVNGDFTSTESAAVNAAATATTNLLTFRRAHFAADFQRALSGTTGSLRSDISDKKAATLSAMTKGKFDLSATVTHRALQGPAESGKQNSYIVLITVNGYQSKSKNIPIPQNLQVTMVKVKGKWLASDLSNIGVTA